MSRKIAAVFSLLILSLLVISIGKMARADSGEVLTADGAALLALENSPRAAMAEKRVEQARARVREISASGAPTLSASLLYQEAFLEPRQPVFIGGIQTGYALAGYRETWKSALTLSWLVYSSGSVENSVRAATLAVEAARAESSRTGQAVEHAARSAFFEVQRAIGRASVAEEALSLVREHQRQAEALFRNGIVARNELLRAKVAVSEAELNRIRTSSAVEVALSGLERVVGVTVRGRYSLPAPNPGEPDPALPEDPFTMALSLRPELKALDFSVRSAKATAAAAAGGKGPSLFIQGEAFSAGQEFYPDAVDDWKISAVAEWKLYDGGKSSARKAGALAAAEELLLGVEDMKRQVDLEVSTALLGLRSALQRRDVASAQVELAEEEYRHAKARYAAQVGTGVEVLDARISLSASRDNLVDALCDVRRAGADMRFAMGLDPEKIIDKR